MDQLWAPWRLSYVAAAKPPCDEDPCFICRGLAAHDDRANLIALRTPRSVVVLNRFPYNNGHLLIAPRAHKGRLDELTADELLEVMETLRRMVGTLEGLMRPDGFNVGLNLGRAAGAGLPGHLHWHIVPRWDGDTNFMPIVADVKVIVQSLDAFYDALVGQLSVQELVMPSEPEVPFEPPDWLDREEEVLAPYAMRTRQSQGRRYPEPPHAFRTAYQRDRDRVIHSTAFRRLMYKTQVLVAQTNDHHRTRLTHTLEVAQISRTIARQLGLNEDLTETIALAHDLGHPPFGHAGEEALDECMRDRGGFEHNRHGLRIVETLEYRYADFPGLNLSREVLEAMAQHSGRRDDPDVAAYLEAGQPLLEAQVVDAADSLAYDTHDVDDAFGVGLLTAEDLGEVEFWRRAVERVEQRHGRIGPLQFQPAVVRALIDWQVTALLEDTRQRLRQAHVRSVEDVRRAAEPLVGPGPEVRRLKAELEAFLHRRVYRHYRVMRMAAKGRRIVQALFAEFLRAPELLPERYGRRVAAEGRERVVCDYLAGMTDRYAQDEFLRLFQPYTPV